MASIGASLLSAAPFVLHGGKTNPRNFQRLPTSFRPVKASLKGNAVATKPLVLTEEPPKSQGLPNVQEMVKNNPSLVPEGYIRSPEEMEIDKTMHHLSSQVPVIDFALLKNGSTEELSKLDFACKEWGYFQIWSNGKYKSAIHRAVTNDSKVRTVHITGLIPARDVHVEPLNHLVRAKNPKLYQKVKVDDYAHIYSSKKLDGRTHIDDVTIEE
ncbi:hypothetical protein RIF29_30802 [Crotalaria pallida]|uniref:Uncharacterized protein n=1 Tax=Crotalaria pallida TaxID=3830 RepID=A0AAN9EGJ7_CROPI